MHSVSLQSPLVLGQPLGQPLSQHFSIRSIISGNPRRLFRITQGVVRTLTYLEDGSLPLVLGLWGAGDVVGGQLSSINPYYMECFTKVEGYFFVPDDTASSLPWITSHLQQIEELMMIRSLKTNDVKLLRMLSWLSSRFGHTGDQGQRIDLRLTHQDLAELAGVTRVTVTRTLGQLETQGRIERLPLGQILLREAAVWYYEI
jgi:Crp-like helix-turn-helix domain